MNLQNGIVQQMIVLHCPVFPPSSNLYTIPNTVAGFEPKLATLHITLVLEDMGPIAEKMKSTTSPEEESIWKKNYYHEVTDIKRMVDLSDRKLKDLMKKRDHEGKDIVKRRDHEYGDEVKMTDDFVSSIDMRMRAGISHQKSEGDGSDDGVGGVVEIFTNSTEYKVAMELDTCRASKERAVRVLYNQ